MQCVVIMDYSTNFILTNSKRSSFYFTTLKQSWFQKMFCANFCKTILSYSSGVKLDCYNFWVHFFFSLVIVHAPQLLKCASTFVMIPQSFCYLFKQYQESVEDWLGNKMPWEKIVRPLISIQFKKGMCTCTVQIVIFHYSTNAQPLPQACSN